SQRRYRGRSQKTGTAVGSLGLADSRTSWRRKNIHGRSNDLRSASSEQKGRYYSGEPQGDPKAAGGSSEGGARRKPPGSVHRKSDGQIGGAEPSDSRNKE